ncbi:hypothetical protein QQF64_011297 [Cirrhinus molitorella]|uniref:Uncharacterized protein n=1 Tax=Cirrhinus molitorella TaxID=172907 RepID=A0ABR3LYU6_9TELE
MIRHLINSAILLLLLTGFSVNSTVIQTPTDLLSENNAESMTMQSITVLQENTVMWVSCTSAQKRYHKPLYITAQCHSSLC